jgi:Na+-transporting methylmalonyl-CoA/oxaloacetate decarboxylase gamma subunit
LNQMAVLLLVLSLLAALAQLMQKPLARFITN